MGLSVALSGGSGGEVRWEAWDRVRRNKVADIPRSTEPRDQLPDIRFEPPDHRLVHPIVIEE